MTRKAASLLSVLLAAAITVMAMPAVRAAHEIELHASGVVAQAAVADQNPAVTLASVHEGGWATRSESNDWDTLMAPAGSGLTLFSGTANLRPGANNRNNRYTFVLINKYNRPISYTYTHGPKTSADNAPIKYTLYVNGSNSPVTVPAQGLAGTVPVGQYVEFELEWLWDYYVNNSQDKVDTALGAAAETYEAELKFLIEAEKAGQVTLIWKDADTGEIYDTWTGLTPGMTIAEAVAAGYVVPEPRKEGYTFTGFKDQDGVLITDDYVILENGESTLVAEVEVTATWEDECKWPAWLLPGIIGGTVIAGGGLLAALAGVPLWVLCIALPVIVLCWLGIHYKTVFQKDDNSETTTRPAAKDDTSSTKKPGTTGYVKPPKTGDSSLLPLFASMCGLTAVMVLATMTRRKRKITAQ